MSLSSFHKTRPILAFAAVLLGLYPVAAPAQTTLPAWAQATSDLKADPAVRFGQLPSGMRYAILKNATPAGQAALRLRIGAGSLDERDDQQGLAHFLEHMAFKGSTHVPEGEMVKILERKGLAFGPDTNAQTSYDQTLYMLDLPEVDEDTLDTGLMLMRETASELTLSAKAFDSERGVILSEERLRDTPQYRAQMALIDLLLDGQRVTQRRPIGKVDIIRNAPVSLVADYYRTYYRPEDATLVVVGDIDPDAIEAKIKARFGDWKANGPMPSVPDLGAVRQRGLTAKVVELPGAGTQVQIAFARPYDTSLDTSAKRRQQLVERLGLTVLNRRFATIARSGNAAFLNAQSGFQDVIDSAKVAIIIAESSPDDWQKALEAVVTEQRRLAQFGVSQAELDREIVEMRATLTSAASGAATRRNVELAASLVDGVDDKRVFTTPASDLALFDAAVKDLKAAEVNKALADIFAGAGPLVQLATPKLPEGGETALRAAYEKALTLPVAAPAQAATIAWPYTSFGTVGTVAEREEVADLGLVKVRFANNVRLIVKPTKFSADQVLITAYVGNGRLALPVDKATAAWASYGFVAGGLKAIDQEDMDKALAAVVGSINFDIDDRAFKLSGTTRPTDLLAQLQIMTAYASDPGFRPEAFPRARAAYLALLPQLDGTPESVLGRDLPAILRSNDPRWGFPSREQVEATKPDDLKGLLGPALASGPLDVTVVGNVSAEEAIGLVAQTFGALPKRDLAPPPAQALAVHFPDPATPTILRTHKGRADQAIALAAWPATDLLTDPAQARVLYLTDDILQSRLLQQIRIAEGATYSPVGDIELSPTFPGFGFAYSYVETPPAKVDSFFANLEKIVADMTANGVTADELARVKTPRIERVKKAFLTNEFWLQYLSAAQAEPRILDYIRHSLENYDRVTPDEVKAAAATFFAGRKPLRMIVLPQDATKPQL